MANAADNAFQKVQIQRDDTVFDAYVVGKEQAPGIVVLQECLYRGKVGLDVAEAQHLMDGLDGQDAIKDIRAVINWLKAGGSAKVGVTGFCMGGALSIASGVLIPEVDAVVAFYGISSSELADPSLIKAPVQAHFGELDSFVGFSDITAAKALGKTEIKWGSI
ncbi:hypothetical protein J5N97_019466 [Dioscorea zingiberensis]|uniref:Dienelactone hydrolase domain-containing protein n=1 Tax=Dioscorea zingiberensis TaxID=325984 RepID=A0A9D5HCR2_9LILI|nr:hypothetical protein J5N97_019466 [Dioscorea zingiberensis]